MLPHIAYPRLEGASFVTHRLIYHLLSMCTSKFQTKGKKIVKAENHGDTLYLQSGGKQLSLPPVDCKIQYYLSMSRLVGKDLTFRSACRRWRRFPPSHHLEEITWKYCFESFSQSDLIVLVRLIVSESLYSVINVRGSYPFCEQRYFSESLISKAFLALMTLRTANEAD